VRRAKGGQGNVEMEERGKVGMKALLLRKGKGEGEGIGGRRKEGRGKGFAAPMSHWFLRT